LNAQVLGISVDHIPCLQAWAENLGGISYPLLSDFWPHGAVAECYGVFRRVEGITERAIFVLDGQGVVRYVDVHDIADQPDNEEIRRVLRQIEGVGAPEKSHAPAAESALDEDEEDTGELREIVLYCARWCKDCKKARAWLEERGLVYHEWDIDYDPEVRSRVREWGGGRLITPVIDFDGTIILDFDVEKLEAALRRRSGGGKGQL
jgi:glutaredoxin